ncbi:MAG: mRNA interferase HigB [Paraglaciecola sp.]|uniref:type II toxin-antitoxin system HigB family toxin n=1 Tax=Polaribacter sp. TaxID=1920175 RepID=UPI003AC13AD1
MRIITKRTLIDFWTLYPETEQQLTAWFRETEKANWQSLNDLKKEYLSVSILEDNRDVFNIKGNNYRLIVKFNVEYQLCWIRFIGTHAAYDKINANKI